MKYNWRKLFSECIIERCRYTCNKIDCHLKTEKKFKGRQGRRDKEGETDQSRICLEMLLTLFLAKRYGGFDQLILRIYITNVEDVENICTKTELQEAHYRGH